MVAPFSLFQSTQRREGDVYGGLRDVYDVFTYPHHCSASTNISTRKNTIVRGNLKTFPKQEKEKCKYVSLFFTVSACCEFLGRSVFVS